MAIHAGDQRAEAFERADRPLELLPFPALSPRPVRRRARRGHEEVLSPAMANRAIADSLVQTPRNIAADAYVGQLWGEGP